MFWEALLLRLVLGMIVVWGKANRLGRFSAKEIGKRQVFRDTLLLRRISRNTRFAEEVNSLACFAPESKFVYSSYVRKSSSI